MSNETSQIDSRLTLCGSSLDKRCFFGNIMGPTGSGKTNLALTAPGPILFVHCVEQTEGMLQQHVNIGKEIHTFNFAVELLGDRKQNMAVAGPMWNTTESVLMDGTLQFRSIIVDTDTSLYMLLRQAHFGSYDAAIKADGGEGSTQKNWGPVNHAWASLIMALKMRQDNHGVNIITISHTADEWSPGLFGKRTGKLVRKGHKDLGTSCDVMFETSIDDSGFCVKIRKPWYNALMMGIELRDELTAEAGQRNINLPAIMSLITEQPIEEWS